MAQPLMSAVAPSAYHALHRRTPLLAAAGIYVATALLGLLRMQRPHQTDDGLA